MSDRSTISLQGIGASAGVAVGPVYLLDRPKARTPKRVLLEEEIEGELARLEDAFELSDHQLRSMKEEVELREGPEHALIIEAHRLMLRDPSFADEARRLVRVEKRNGEWAVRRCARKLRSAFTRLEDEYFQERRHDISYVADRVVRNLMGERPTREALPSGVILMARDLSPADAALLLEPGKVLGLVTERGTKVSHTAIVAHARGVPAVVGVARASQLVRMGDEIAIDGERGEVVLRPDPEGVVRFAKAKARHERVEEVLAQERLLRSVTADGVEIGLDANIEFLEELPTIARSGARGIGLFRTEFLYLGRDELPSEEDHFQAYKELIEAMEGRPVTIRTLDIGADKLPSDRLRRDEPNPSLGLRGLRIAKRRPEILEVQLRALLRAAELGPLRILFPMISCLSELRDAKAAVERVRKGLIAEGHPLGEPPLLGVMIEVPSAVHLSDRLAKEADFFAIGTNDLIQYSMAIDRQNREVAYLYRPAHLAILRMIGIVIQAAKERGIPVSVCGEMAGEPYYALILLGMGIRELSMTASALALVRRVVRASTIDDAELLVQNAMALDTSEEIEDYVRRTLEARFADLLEGVSDAVSDLA